MWIYSELGSYKEETLLQSVQSLYDQEISSHNSPEIQTWRDAVFMLHCDYHNAWKDNF